MAGASVPAVLAALANNNNDNDNNETENGFGRYRQQHLQQMQGSSMNLSMGDGQKFILVDSSEEAIAKWPEVKKGYARLCGFCTFMVLYIVILALQLNVGESFAIDSAFRNMLSGVDGVATQDQFWDYLYKNDPQNGESGILSSLLVNTWYNGQSFSTSEQGFILNYNKLVGGVLIVQQRSNTTDDGCVSILGDSSYSKFYPSCYLGGNIDENIAKNVYKGGIAGEYYYGSADVLKTDLATSFKYNNDTKGFSVFFGLAEGRATNLKKLTDLKNNLWTDKSTRSVQVKFAFYNGNLGLFTFCDLSFNFDVGGIFTNGNNVRIQSMNMEPYRSTTDYVRLAMEIIFMAWTAQQTMDFILEILSNIRNKRPLFTLWFFVDLANLTLFFVYFGYRISVMSMIYSSPIQVPTNKYQEILEDVATVQNSQLVINFLNIFVGLLRFFKYYQFQERLNVLNQTFAIAFTDLYHFVIMFAVIFGGYSVMAHILFGPSVRNYSSMGLSLQTCWQMLLGAFNYDEMNYVNPEMAAIFFISFMFLIFFVLVNVLLAILIDAYTKACAGDFTTIGEQLGQGMQLAASSLSRGPQIDQSSVLKALESLHRKGMLRATAAEVAKECGGGGGIIDPRILEKLPGMKFADDDEKDGAGVKGKGGEVVVHGYPVQLVGAMETVLRENTYLRHRVRAHDVE